MSRPRLVDRAKWYAKIKYTPRNGQRAMDAAADAGYRFLALFAFPQAGKSYGAARHVEPDILAPDTHGWIVAPKYELGGKEFGYIYADFLNTGVLKLATHKSFDVRGGNMNIEFPNGSFVRVVSADNPDSLRMEQLDWVILSEASALPRNIYERFLYARVELRKGKVLVPTTPSGYNWVFDAFRIPSLENLEFDYGPWEGTHRERLGGTPNPRYDPAYWSAVVSAVPDFGDILEPGIHTDEAIQRARRLLPHQTFVEQFGGDFASYAGLIYAFDPIEHECDPFRIPDNWTHVVGWDHGADNPTAILFGSYSPTGVLYWWDEIYQAGLSAAEYAQQVRSRLGQRAPSAIVIDPSAKQVRIELMRVGLTTTTPYDKQIEARITKTTSLMRGGQWKVLRGRCPNLVSEIKQWEWDERNPGKPRPRQRCHALDAVGYASLAQVALPGPYVNADPDAIMGETVMQEWVWKPWRKKMREEEAREEGRTMESVLESSPFEETSFYPEEYAFDTVVEG